MPLVPLTMLLVERIVIVGPESVTPISIITYVFIAIWGLRLAYDIASRYGGPDARYVELMKFDAGCPEPLKAISIWIKIFVFQASLSILSIDTAIKIFYFSDP